MTRQKRDSAAPKGHEAGAGPAVAEFTYEAALSRLEEVVEALEQGNESLERSLELFEEGIRLSRVLTARLEQAQARIERVVGDGSGGIRFEAEEDPSSGTAPEPEEGAPDA